MNTHPFESSSGSLPSFENLESRRLLSFALPTATILPIPTPVPPVNAPVASVAGRLIHAEANQAFKVVLGTIPKAAALPAPYALRGSINWGDGTPASSATFLRQPNGSIAVIGSHTYAAVGKEAITVTVIAAPPPGTLAPVRLLGYIRSTALVIDSSGGVTVQETASVPFTAAVGSFSSTLSSLNMTATIDWGDGTTSLGKILALPVAAPGPTSPIAGGRFEVVGTHTYAQSRSYLVKVIVTSTTPPPLAGPSTSDVTLLVADIQSVIDVLPVSPIAAR